MSLDVLVAQARFSATILFGRSDRPLLVPRGDDGFALEAIQLFVHGKLRRTLATLLFKLDHWLPRLSLLPDIKTSQLPLPEIYQELGISDDAFAVYYGSPGPLRKLTIYSASANDRSVTKIALQATADAMISNEGRILAMLADQGVGVNCIPCLISHGELSSGRRFVRTSVLPAGRRAPDFGRMHSAFLAELYAHRDCVTVWEHGHSYRALRSNLETLRTNLDRAHVELIDASIGEIALLSGNEPVAECIVHGDFAPWNISVMHDRLCVFDWESATMRGNPLHDFLHFHLIPDALLRRTQSLATLKRLVQSATAHMAEITGHRPGERLVAALILQYLTETLVFFCVADGELKLGHPIIRSYLRLLRSRRTWLPITQISGGGDHER